MPGECPWCGGFGYTQGDGEGDVDPCYHPTCSYWTKREAGRLQELASMLPQAGETDAINRRMDLLAEIEAGPTPASEGASDQGDEAWVATTIDHLRQVGYLPC